MKKILSIILALGLVLSMSLAAMPVLADDDCDADVVITNDCAGALTTYCVTFDSKYHMIWGDDKIGIEFPAEVTFGATQTATVNAVAVAAAGVVKVGQVVWVTIPSALVFAPGDPITVCITGIRNPAEGEYTLNVWIDLLCCPAEQIDCGVFEIAPKYSTYKFVLDFTPTYAGIMPGIIPPFQACGQPDGVANPNGPDGNLYAQFDLTLKYDKLGCEGYDPVIINFWLEDIDLGTQVDPEEGEVTLILFGWHGPGPDLDWHEFTLNIEDEDKWQWGFAPDGFELANDYDVTTEGLVHFNIPGYYKICFELEYLGEEITCEEDIPSGLLIEPVCYTAQVMQNKDTFVHPGFEPKWNFFSTPLRLKYDAVDVVFAPVAANLKMVLHYDNVAGKWFHYSPNSVLPAGMQPLSKIEDGKGYLVRMKTDYEGWDATANFAMWQWGHAQAYAPAWPFTYNVAEGWTMMGYTSLVSGGSAADYLLPATAINGGIFELNPATNAYGPVTMFYPGFGYWVYFDAAGQVVPGSPAL